MNHSLQKRADILQERYGLKITSCLSESADRLPYDISERLRAARMQALAQRKAPKTQTAATISRAGASAALTWGGPEDGISWWARIGSAVPLVALVVGLLVINSIQEDNRAQEIAEVDAALLTDELPPAAFSDPGFVQYLKSTR